MDVFVYGTLTNPERARAVVDSFVFVGPAVLEGLRVVDGEYPTLAPPADDGAGDDGSPTAPPSGDGWGTDGMAGSEVAGRLLRTDDVAALDAYEAVDEGLYVRVSVPLVDGTTGRGGTADGTTGAADGSDTAADGPREAAVYVGDPDRLDAPASWPGEGPFAERVEAVLADRGVRVRIRPTG